MVLMKVIKFGFGMRKNLINSSFYEESSKFTTHIHVKRLMLEVYWSYMWRDDWSCSRGAFKRTKWDLRSCLLILKNHYTMFSTLVKLYNLKVRYWWSDANFLELLKSLKENLPTTNELQTSLYGRKKTLGALGMEYEKIHGCPNNCCLYKKEFANAIECCPKCGQWSWKIFKDTNEERKKFPSKVIWYFPPILQFKRLFSSIECAEKLDLTC